MPMVQVQSNKQSQYLVETISGHDLSHNTRPDETLTGASQSRSAPLNVSLTIRRDANFVLTPAQTKRIFITSNLRR